MTLCHLYPYHTFPILTSPVASFTTNPHQDPRYFFKASLPKAYPCFVATGLNSVRILLYGGEFFRPHFSDPRPRRRRSKQCTIQPAAPPRPAPPWQPWTPPRSPRGPAPPSASRRQSHDITVRVHPKAQKPALYRVQISHNLDLAIFCPPNHAEVITVCNILDSILLPNPPKSSRKLPIPPESASRALSLYPRFIYISLLSLFNSSLRYVRSTS